jgi:glycerol uptake facilitator-like aquaporin
MEAATARARIGAWTGWRPTEAAIEARTVEAYAAEGIGTFLLVFFICAVISVANTGVLQLAGLGSLHALTLGVLVYALGATSGGHLNPAITVDNFIVFARQILRRR